MWLRFCDYFFLLQFCDDSDSSKSDGSNCDSSNSDNSNIYIYINGFYSGKCSDKQSIRELYQGAC